MFKIRVTAESSVMNEFYSGKLQSKHSFPYSELSRHRRGSIHLRYIEVIGMCWPGNGEWPFVSVTQWRTQGRGFRCLTPLPLEILKVHQKIVPNSTRLWKL